MLIGSSYIYYYLKAKNREKIQEPTQPNFKLQKLHDELANDVYQLMKFVENKDISYAKIKKPSCKTLILFTISPETYLLQTVILKREYILNSN
jgi:hypothetical protein